MRTLYRFSRKRAAFVPAIFRTLGNGTKATLEAGYTAGSAPSMASQLLRDDRVLALIAAEIRRGRPGGDAVMRRLLLPGRPIEARIRFQMLLRNEGVFAELIEHNGKFMVVTDPDEVALRDHVVRLRAASKRRSPARRRKNVTQRLPTPANQPSDVSGIGLVPSVPTL